MMPGDKVVVLMEQAVRRLAPAGSDAAGVGGGGVVWQVRAAGQRSARL